MNRLTTILLQLAENALPLQDANGAFTAGTNGAYGDIDTPIRNTAHWVYSFAEAFLLTGDSRFAQGAEAGISYMKECIRLCKGGAVMRLSTVKDMTNGILGPAHVLEAISKAAMCFGRSEWFDLAVSYYRRHTFDPSLGLWNCTAPSGEKLPPDNTFNHQLYFAAVAAHLDDNAARHHVETFVHKLPKNVSVYPNGLIKHLVASPSSMPRLSLKRRVKKLLRASDEVEKKRCMNYHLYNMYGLALLQTQISHRLTETTVNLAKALQFAFSDEFTLFRERTEKATTIIQSGTETIACDYVTTRRVFSDDAPEKHEDQLIAFLTKTQGPFGSAGLFSPDPRTQQARIYRYFRCLSQCTP